jgi:hypothetical protein
MGDRESRMAEAEAAAARIAERNTSAFTGARFSWRRIAKALGFAGEVAEWLRSRAFELDRDSTGHGRLYSLRDCMVLVVARQLSETGIPLPDARMLAMGAGHEMTARVRQVYASALLTRLEIVQHNGDRHVLLTKFWPDAPDEFTPNPRIVGVYKSDHGWAGPRGDELGGAIRNHEILTLENVTADVSGALGVGFAMGDRNAILRAAEDLPNG